MEPERVPTSTVATSLLLVASEQELSSIVGVDITDSQSAGQVCPDIS